MTNQFTDEQIVAEAMVDAGAPLMHSRVEEAVVSALRDAGRLAAGVAPQAPSVPGQLTRKFDGGRGAMLNEAGSIVGYYTPPVQPSSTVDEDALAEVIRRSYENEQGLKIRDDKRTARAVAEWLRGESR